jgi:hypothetical protein
VKNIFLFLCILFFSQLGFSNPSIQQIKDDEIDNKISKYVNPPAEEIQKYKEDVFVYYRFGDVVGRFPNPDKTHMYAIGYRRLPDNFFYGMEVASYTSENDLLKITATQAHVGYRVIWNNRFLPYTILHIGSASLKDSSGLYEDTSGVATGVDLGMDVVRFMKVKMSVGMRYNHMSFKSSLIPQSSFTELYSIIGFEF